MNFYKNEENRKKTSSLFKNLDQLMTVVTTSSIDIDTDINAYLKNFTEFKKEEKWSEGVTVNQIVSIKKQSKLSNLIKIF